MSRKMDHAKERGPSPTGYSSHDVGNRLNQKFYIAQNEEQALEELRRRKYRAKDKRKMTSKEKREKLLELKSYK